MAIALTTTHHHVHHHSCHCVISENIIHCISIVLNIKKAPACRQRLFKYNFYIFYSNRCPCAFNRIHIHIIFEKLLIILYYFNATNVLLSFSHDQIFFQKYFFPDPFLFDFLLFRKSLVDVAP